MDQTLPSPRRPEAGYRLALVCLGNICRSAMAQVVLEHRLAEEGLAPRIAVASAGTGEWHIGEPMDPAAAQTLTAAGYDGSRHRARLFDTTWIDDYDLLLGMDVSNLAELTAKAEPAGELERVRLFRSYDPDADAGGDLDVPDPWGRGPEAFHHVLDIVERTTTALVPRLRAALAPT